MIYNHIIARLAKLQEQDDNINKIYGLYNTKKNF